MQKSCIDVFLAAGFSLVLLKAICQEFVLLNETRRSCSVNPPAQYCLCGAFVNTPQFLLAGIAGRGGEVPKLTPANASYPAICAEVASHVPGATCTANGAAGAVTLPWHRRST